MPKDPKTGEAATSATAGVDAVEIKVTVSEKQEKSAEKAFGLSRKEGERREIYFFDTRNLDLFGKGVALRARKVENAKDDSTVKIRPVDPQKVSAKWRHIDGFKIEADGVGGRMIRSASFSIEQKHDEIDEVALGRRSIAKLFSSEQEAFLREMGQGPIVMKSLEVLGPVDARRWKLEHPGLPYLITIEDWRLSDGQDLLELSIKVPSAQAAAAAAAFTGFLTELGLPPEGGQQTKTRVVLEFFVKKLRQA